MSKPKNQVRSLSTYQNSSEEHEPSLATSKLEPNCPQVSPIKQTKKVQFQEDFEIEPTSSKKKKIKKVVQFKLPKKQPTITVESFRDNKLLEEMPRASIQGKKSTFGSLTKMGPSLIWDKSGPTPPSMTIGDDFDDEPEDPEQYEYSGNRDKGYTKRSNYQMSMSKMGRREEFVGKRLTLLHFLDEESEDSVQLMSDED
jgi:hypothetical protein